MKSNIISNYTRILGSPSLNWAYVFISLCPTVLFYGLHSIPKSFRTKFPTHWLSPKSGCKTKALTLVLRPHVAPLAPKDSHDALPRLQGLLYFAF